MTHRRAVFVAASPKTEARYSYRWQEESVCQSAPEADKAALTSGYPTKRIARDMDARYCSRCPVMAQCLAWANSEFAFSGIAGGHVFTGEKAAGRSRRIIRIGAEDNE